MERTEIESLYRKLGPIIYGRCIRLLGDREEAKDATQEVFIQVIRYAGRIDDAVGYLPWLYKVATNNCLKRIHRRAREESRYPEEIGQELLQPEPGQKPHALDLVKKLLGLVDRQTGEIAVYSHVYDMTQEEIAEALGISRRTVGKKLRHFNETSRRFIEAQEETGH